MVSPKTKGRMLNKDISDSKGFALLSPGAAVLFCMMVPHYTPYGKMNGDPGYLKGEVCPRVPYLTIKNIPILLGEIDAHTSVKWFQYDGRYWIHSIKFISEHQHINMEKVGPDLLPSYSGIGPELHPPEVEVEVEVKGEVEVEDKVSGKPDVAPVDEVIEYLNLKAGKRFNPKAEVCREKITARWKEGARIEQFKAAIENQVRDWKGTDMEKYLRPVTLFGKEKFDGYVNNTRIIETNSTIKDTCKMLNCDHKATINGYCRKCYDAVEEPRAVDCLGRPL